MWVFLNDAFLSIVAHRTKPGILLVRARRKGEIEAVFPLAKVRRTPDHDYLFRAEIPQYQVARAISDRLLEIDYPDFKGSVWDRKRHDAYAGVWDQMRAYQDRGHDHG